MGKFNRLKNLIPPVPIIDTPTFINGVKTQGSWMTRPTEPVTRQESFVANRYVALNMIKSFQYRRWMRPYLTDDELGIVATHV